MTPLGQGTIYDILIGLCAVLPSLKLQENKINAAVKSVCMEGMVGVLHELFSTFSDV